MSDIVLPRPITFRRPAIHWSAIPKFRLHWPSFRTVEKTVIIAVILSGFSESLFPESGIITRIQYGNAVANQNYIARSLLWGNDTDVLTFEVAGHKYQVRSPGHAITADEQNAINAFIAFKHWPLWAVDGPAAVDP